MATSYIVKNGDTVVGTKSKKAQAEALAQSTAKELKTTITVVTSNGTEVGTFKARKAQVKTTPYTRVEQLPEDFKVPEGFRVAYRRARKAIAIAHNAETGEYRVINAKGHALAKGLETTRDAGAFCKTVPLPEKVSA